MVANRYEFQPPTLKLVPRPGEGHREPRVIEFPGFKDQKAATPETKSPVFERFKKPSPFNFLDSYEHYAHWRSVYDLAEASNRIRWKLLGDLTSLRNEGLGAQWTHDIVTEVVWQPGELRFKNLQYKEGEDLISMYQNSLQQLSPEVEPELRRRYELEISQTIGIWEACAAVLKKLEFGTPSEVVPQLLQQGFAPVELPLTLGLKATFPELARQTTATARVLLGPPIVTISPPSPIHRQGESSFGWSNRLVFIPEINRFAVMQNGAFTAYNQEEITQFLRFRNSEFPPMTEEAQLMSYLNILPAEFTARHSLSILSQIIEEIGYFKALSPIDKNIRPGAFSHQQHVEAMLEIFEFEFQQVLSHPNLAVTLEQRFAQWETAIMHNAIGGFTDFNAAQFVAAYRALYSNKEIAEKPHDFLKATSSLISSAYPSVSKFLDFSKIDCVSGMFTRLNGSLKLGGLDQLIGLPATKLLQQAEQHGLMSEAELDHFCKTFKLPRELFKRNTENKLCPGCVANGNKKPPTFIGPCVCAVCHAKDNLGLKTVPTPTEKPATDSVPEPLSPEFPLRRYKKSVSTTEMLSGDIYEDFIPQDINGIIEQWPKSASSLRLLPTTVKPKRLAA